jgi:putative ABC transport system permease protein
MKPVLVAARAAVTRRRLQTWIIGVVVLLTATTSVVALGLLAVSHAPFDAAFDRAAGAHLTVTTTTATDTAELAATSHLASVVAAAGPYDQVTASMMATAGPVSGARFRPASIVGRATAGGDVDRLTLDAGSWLSGPGQIVLSRDYAGPLSEPAAIGSEITLDLPGSPTLRLVGIADSVTGSADGWVWPTDTAILAAPAGRQVLYRLAAAGSTADLAAGLATITAALPAGAVTASANWLTVRQAANRSISAFVPFVIAFAVLGLILSVLITANVVNGAVVAGFRTIGVLKTLGFTPGQVVAAYVVQVAVPAVVGCLFGVVGGVLLAAPLLAETERAYNLPASVAGVPLWVLLVVAVGAPVLVAVSALGPALRAGRLAANEAISVGRAPRVGRGFRIRRALTATRLPRPVAFGLGMPVARPARTAGTVVAILLGAMTLVLAVGLSASLARVHTAFTRTDAVPVVVHLPSADGSIVVPKAPAGTVAPPRTPADPTAVAATIAAQAGTARIAGLTDREVHLAGVVASVTVETYSGDASWTGFRLITGHWYGQPGEVVASSYLLRQTGHKVGDQLVLTGDLGQRTVTITGSYLDGRNGYDLVADTVTMSALTGTITPDDFEIGLEPGQDVGAFATALQAAFPLSSGVIVDDRTTHNDNRTFEILYGLISTLTLLLCAAAALGVLNTVVLNTRERRYDIGVLKAIGMTPGQVRVMIVASMTGLGVLAAALAVPLGVALQHWIVPTMGAAAGTDLPRTVIEVYGAAELVGLGACGVLLAVIGALVPAGWAASIRAAHALRAE